MELSSGDTVYGMMVVMISLLIIAVIAIDVLVLIRLARAFRLLRFRSQSSVSQNNLPSVTICIAARNETHAMTQCLERVVASEYPKLEVIVLDDSSRDDTSVLIKSFAHAGVRFIEGSELPDGWLGKNYAQSVLAQEASGKIVFFMDVDTLIERHTVSRAVAFMQSKNLKMLSIIPMRSERLQISTLFTTLRHFWLIMRHHPEHPRATANAWLIDRDLLLDEFEQNASLPTSMKVETAVADKITPRETYKLVLSDSWLGLKYEKRWTAQIETSIRILYLQCHKRMSEVLGLALLLVLILVPYALVWIHPICVVPIILNYLVAYYYLSSLWPRYALLGALVLPITIIQEVALLLLSAYKHKFGVVTWKGRPIHRIDAVRRPE